MKIPAELLQLLIDAPDTQIDSSIIEEVKQWNGEPSSLDILFCLDKMAAFSLASEFGMTLFNMLLEMALKDEETTLDEIKSKRTWEFPDFIR